MNMQHYQDFDTNDFINDNYFKEWIQNPSHEIDLKWSQWLKENPDKADTVAEARDILERMSFTRYKLPDERVDALWSKIEEEASSVDMPKVIEMRPSFYRRNIGKIAASIALLFVTSLLFLVVVNKSSEVVYATSSGEIREVTLPDQSVIVLNENTELRYASDFMEDDSRKVWIKGEGFFEVTKRVDEKKRHMPFVVYLENATVTVLGTSFNIQERDGTSEVVLQTGSVRVGLLNNDQQYTLVPGNMIAVRDGVAELKTVNPRFFSSWKEGTLIFEELSLEEIASVIERTYGLRVEFQDEELKSKRFKGTFPADNHNMLFKALERAYDLEVIVKGDSVSLRKKTSN